MTSRQFMQQRLLVIALLGSMSTSVAHGQHLVLDQEFDTVLISPAGSAGNPGDTGTFAQITIEAVVWCTSFPLEGWQIYTELQPFAEDKQLLARQDLGAAGSILVGGFSNVSGAPGFAVTGAAPNPFKWVHIAYQYDGAQEQIYIDGHLVASRDVVGTIGEGLNEQSRIGAISRGSGGIRRSFRGAIDSLRVSDVARYSGETYEPPLGDMALDSNTRMLFRFNEQPDSEGRIYSADGGFVGSFGAALGGGATSTSPDVQFFVPCLSCLDVDGDGRINIDDLNYITQHPTDINGDGIADAEDAACLERYLRRNEIEDMTAGRR